MATNGKASSWTLGLAASLALHAVVLGLMIGTGKSGAANEPDEPAEEPAAETALSPAPTREPADEPARPTVLTPTVLTPAAGAATGSLADITTNTPRVDAPAAVLPAVHVVRQGDTVTKIAAAYGLTPAELAKINGRKLSEWNNIWVGQKIKLRKQ
jgi:LysM repeat protein